MKVESRSEKGSQVQGADEILLIQKEGAIFPESSLGWERANLPWGPRAERVIMDNYLQASMFLHMASSRPE